LTDDELTRLEEERGQRDIGVLAVRVYAGARAEASSSREAFWATVAALVAMMAKPDGPEEAE
jgi:hypothetical protein